MGGVNPVGIGLFPPVSVDALPAVTPAGQFSAAGQTTPFQNITATWGIKRRSFTVAEWATCNTVPIKMVDGIAGAVLTPVHGWVESNVPTNGSIGGIAYGIWAGSGGTVPTAGTGSLTSTFNGYTGVTVPPKKLIEQFVGQGTVTFTDQTRTGLDLYVRAPSNPAQQANSTVVVTLVYMVWTPVPAL